MKRYEFHLRELNIYIFIFIHLNLYLKYQPRHLLFEAIDYVIV